MPATVTDSDLVRLNQSRLQDDVPFDVSLTFSYFLEFLRTMRQQYPLYRSFFTHVLRKYEEVPGLAGTLKDVSVMQQYPELLNLLIATLFPPVEKEREHLFAFSTPWQFRPFHISEKLDEIFHHNIIISTPEALNQFRQDKAERHFAHILERHYGLHIEVDEQNIYPATDAETGLTKYYHIHYDMRFSDVLVKGALPSIDRDYIEKNFTTLCDTMEITTLLPPDHFTLEGFTVIRVVEVTEIAAVTKLKNVLLHMLDNASANYFPEVDLILQSLVGVPGAEVSLLPFPRINNHICWWDETGRDKLLGAALQKDASGALFKAMEQWFTANPDTILASSFPSDDTPAFLLALEDTGIKSYLLTPLFRGRDLIGVLEIATYRENDLQKRHTYRLQPARVLLIQVLSNYLQQRHDTVEQLIKDQFTSLQSPVEWKFREVAYQYLKERSLNPAAEIGPLIFEQVYPAYGAIDIRSSSIRRSEAIQQDLVENLQLVGALTAQLRAQHDLPVLQELEFKALQYLAQVQKELTVETEAYVGSFIEGEVTEGLRFLALAFPDMQAPIGAHLEKTNKEKSDCCQNRKHYEQSVVTINRTLSLYLQKEQAKLQALYPHLYEKYETDGVEYNIYIGQSIQPGKPFHPLHRRNIYLWQLNTMVDMARLTNNLVSSLPVPLQTTQLILLYGSPITISFRRDERKFDVDDAYNIRYELLKKRIDKVCIKGTDERLTQPGKVAIIYSRAKDATVFEKYIDYLVNAGRLWPTVEQLDLEDTQGVTGLRALRVQVRYE